MKTILPALFLERSQYIVYLRHLILVIITCLATIFSLEAYAQEEDYELHDEKLRGTARSLTFYNYVAMSGDAMPNYASLKYKSIQYYNQQGQITKFKMYSRWHFWAKYTDSYEYDLKGRLIRIKYDDEDNPSIDELQYDNEGNRIKERHYTLSHELKYETSKIFKDKKLIEEDITAIHESKIPLRRIYTYDFKGSNVLFQIIDRTGKLIVVTTYKYDSKGKISSFITKDFNDNVTTNGSYVYKYYPNGKLKEEVYNSGKYPLSRTIYDDLGRTLREISYSGDGPNDVMSDEKYKYDKTDSHGNWTQRSRYNNGYRTILEIREIEY